LDVAAGVPAAVEGGIPAARKSPRHGSSRSNISPHLFLAKLFPPDWKLRLHGRPEARRYGATVISVADAAL
jgi:hypothetical protein